MRVVAAVYAFAGFFVVVAAAAIVIGVHDASLDQAGFGVTAGSALLIAIGIVLAVAAYQLFRLGPGSTTWSTGGSAGSSCATRSSIREGGGT
jgi:hypothetical protein